MLTPKRGIEHYHRIDSPATGEPVKFARRYCCGNSHLALFPIIEPPVFDSDAIAKPSLLLQEVLLCQGFSYPPLVEPGVYVKPKGRQQQAGLTLVVRPAYSCLFT